MKRLTFAGPLAVLLMFIAAAPAAAGPGRTLKMVTLRSGAPGVEGTGWGHRPVTVSVSEGRWVVGITVQPNDSGTFRLASTSLNLCARPLFRAYDAHGHYRAVAGPPLGCAAPADPPRPRLRAVVGRQVTAPTVQIPASRPTSVTLHRGDILYLWEPGTNAPAWTPSVEQIDSPNATALPLALVDQGQTAARMCPEVDCAAGFYWKWLAVKTGDTAITLSAACRASKPPCMVPDFIIRVHIIP